MLINKITRRGTIFHFHVRSVGQTKLTITFFLRLLPYRAHVCVGVCDLLE